MWAVTPTAPHIRSYNRSLHYSLEYGKKNILEVNYRSAICQKW